MIEIAARTHRCEQSRYDIVGGGVLIAQRVAHLGVVDAAMRPIGTQQEPIAREQFDVRDRRFELGLRAEAAPKETARARPGQRRHLRTAHGRIGKHRVVGRQHFQPAEPGQIRACIADVSDEGVRADDEHDVPLATKSSWLPLCSYSRAFA